MEKFILGKIFLLCGNTLNEKELNSFQKLKTNFMAVKESDEFLKLDVDELIYLLRSDELFVDSENDVFVAAMNWLNFETGNRQQFAARFVLFLIL